MTISKQAKSVFKKAEKNWLSLKDKLIERHSWLEAYRDIAVPIDETIYEAVKDIRIEAPYPHEVLLTEPLLADVAALLERCSTYRRELYTLEVNAISSALTFKLGSETANIDGQISTVRNRKEEADVLKQSHQSAAAEFGESPALNKGFKTESEGQAAAFDKMSTRESQLKTLESQKFANIGAFNDGMLKAIAAPGSGFNYAERYNQLKELLIEDFQEAYQKARCAEIGLKSIFPSDDRFKTFNDHPVPSPKKAGYLNELISWTREAMRRIERISEFETEYDVMVPLTRALVKGSQPLVSRVEFNKSIRNNPDGDGRLEFDLKDIFPSQTAVRLRSVGLSYYRNSEDDHFIKGNRRLRCILFTPGQRPGSGPAYRRPPAILNNVGELIVEHAGTTIESGQNLYNVDPRGKWTLLIYSRAYSSSGVVTTELEERDNLVFNGDIILHLRVRSIPKVNPDDWSVI